MGGIITEGIWVGIDDVGGDWGIHGWWTCGGYGYGPPGGYGYGQ